MIKLMNDLSEALKASEMDPVLGSRIYTLFLCYKNDFSFCRLWTAVNNNNDITACISIMGGAATVCACENCDFEELAVFFGGDDTIDSFEISENISENLNRYLKLPFTVHPVMKYDPLTPYTGAKFSIYTDVIKYAYSILKGSDKNFEDTDFISWFYDTFSRRKNNCCEVYAIKDNEKWVSTGGYYMASPKRCIIGGIATLPEDRKKGYASELVKYISHDLAQKNKEVYLIAAEQNLIKFYENTGFSHIYDNLVLKQEIPKK